MTFENVLLIALIRENLRKFKELLRYKNKGSVIMNVRKTAKMTFKLKDP